MSVSAETRETGERRYTYFCRTPNYETTLYAYPTGWLALCPAYYVCMSDVFLPASRRRFFFLSRRDPYPPNAQTRTFPVSIPATTTTTKGQQEQRFIDAARRGHVGRNIGQDDTLALLPGLGSKYIEPRHVTIYFLRGLAKG